MNIKWSTFHRPDGSTHRQIEVTPSADWEMFDILAHALLDGLHGRWCEKLDGLDQRYWDLTRDGATITLHLEVSLGITLFAAGGAGASASSEDLLEEAYVLLSSYDLNAGDTPIH